MSTEPTDPKDQTRITLRLPQRLAAALRQRAAEDRRSLNSEILFLLENAAYPIADADAYREARRTLSSMPRYTFKPLNRRGRLPGGET